MVKRQFLSFMVVVSCIAASAGCASLSDYHFKRVNEKRALAAWKETRDCLCEDDDTADFADGFQEGYVDASRGGDGTPPPVPPNRYWGPKFQTPEGCARVSKWYSGFARGSSVAHQHGRNRWNNVPSATY